MEDRGKRINWAGAMAGVERRVFRVVLYWVAIAAVANLTMRDRHTEAADVSREAMTWAVCGTVAAAGLAASSKGNRV